MDPTLQKQQPHNRILTFLKLIQCSLQSCVSRQRCHLLITLVSSVTILQTGCQTQRLWDANTALPVPPKVLDQETLQGVRFQSPGGSSSRGGSASRGANVSEESFLPAPEQRQSDVVPDFEQLADIDDGLKPEVVKEVVIIGNQYTPTHHLTRNIRTRQGRYFDPDKLQQDVNTLWRLPTIKKVKGPYLFESKLRNGRNSLLCHSLAIVASLTGHCKRSQDSKTAARSTSTKYEWPKLASKNFTEKKVIHELKLRFWKMKGTKAK